SSTRPLAPGRPRRANEFRRATDGRRTKGAACRLRGLASGGYDEFRRATDGRRTKGAARRLRGLASGGYDEFRRATDGRRTKGAARRLRELASGGYRERRRGFIRRVYLMTASSARRILDRCGRVFDPHGPAIWVRRPRILEAKTPLIGRTYLEGVFHLRPWAPGRPTDPRRKLSFRNLLTDLGLDQMGSGTENFRRCAVGTGTAAPDVTDTTLQNQTAATISIQSQSNGNEGGATAGAYGYHRRVFRFGQGVAAGNLAEIGIGGGTG